MQRLVGRRKSCLLSRAPELNNEAYIDTGAQTRCNHYSAPCDLRVSFKNLKTR